MAEEKDIRSTSVPQEMAITRSLSRPAVDIGLAYRDLDVYGFGTRVDYQRTFANYPQALLQRLLDRLRRVPKTRLDILRDAEGLVESGELLLVLGRPGSGCSTFLKTLAGQTYGFHVDPKARINYQGISPRDMYGEFRGRAVHQAEIDCHFPHLTVRQTLNVAAQVRRPLQAGEKVDPNALAERTAASLGLSKALDTKVGNDFVQGVSGGERKRTSIAEILAGDTWLQCWDNSTRGLDSATALNFVKTMSASTRERGSVAVVSLYQASQDIYNLFDKVLLLYEGRQIYFGSTQAATSYFTALGFICPERSNGPDFLTSVTNPHKRRVRPGDEARAPRTPDEFAETWKRSPERAALLRDIQQYEDRYPVGGAQLERFRAMQKAQKATSRRPQSPYMVSLARQVRVLLVRGVQRMHQDMPAVIGNLVGNTILSLILGSVFYNLAGNTGSFTGRAVLIFFAVILNSNLGAFEGMLLWEHRPIVEKHYRYAFYQPIAEAMSSMTADLPNKLLLIVGVNTPFYFLANLRRTAEAFFTFLLFSFVSLVVGSMLWRFSGAASKTVAQAQPPGSAFATLLILYTGFVIPIPYMHPWLRWFAYINPYFYAFESLMVNEFSGREFPCTTFIPQGPGYDDAASLSRECTTVGAVPGALVVDGDAYLATFSYFARNKWRNLGIMFAIMAFFFVIYLLATEYISLQKSKGDVLLFRKQNMLKAKMADVEEAKTALGPETSSVVKASRSSHPPSQTSLDENSGEATFLWEGLSYEVPVKDGNKKILNDIEGWIRPGTLTALIGATGAGKTTLLNVLAERVGTGVIDGFIGVDSKSMKGGFARKIGYAQQQDLHLSTATVREALEFSALLRQPAEFSKAEKLAYVDTVIHLLEMEKFVDSVIGVPGEGLNIEQRKRLTIGVELATRPELLIFLDEPTSGLDSDTAWSICALLRKLANSGQAIMCTIHQPSGQILEMFDRLLVLSEGRQVYFGDIGPRSQTLTSYFKRFGARRCEVDENPAEWLLDLLDKKSIDWPAAWESSDERSKILSDIMAMKPNLVPLISADTASKSDHDEYPVPFMRQLYMVTWRVLCHDWRTPSYLWSKYLMIFLLAFFNGVSVWQSPNTMQGLQNQFFSLFLFFTICPNLAQLIIYRFVELRTLYESRERPSRTFSWKVFVLANIIAEVPSQTLAAILVFFPWYYGLGWNHNAAEAGALHERSGLMFLFVWTFLLWTQTFGQMLAALLDQASAVAIGNLIYILTQLFCGLLVRPDDLPRVWIFLYRVSPPSYYVSGMFSAGVAGVKVTCDRTELSIFDPPIAGQTCRDYLAAYLASSSAHLLNPDATRACEVCPLSNTTPLLASFNIRYENRWRDWAIALSYVVVNVALALLFYWLVRVPKGAKTGAGGSRRRNKKKKVKA